MVSPEDILAAKQAVADGASVGAARLPAERATRGGGVMGDINGENTIALPRGGTCPACDAGATYFPDEGRWYHQDHSDNGVCWAALGVTSNGSVTEQAKEHEETGEIVAVGPMLSDVEPERIEWLWPGRLARGKLHLVDGDPGLGKSTIGYDWAARLSTGASWPDGQDGVKAGTVIMSAEDGLADTIRPRLDAHGADHTRIIALTGVRYVDADGNEHVRMPDLGDLRAMREYVQRVDAAMLIIDPLAAYLPADVKAHVDTDVRRALAPLARLAEKTGVAVVLIRHLRKSGGKAIYAGGGSIGIIGAARVGFVVAEHPDEDGRKVMAVSKVNIAAAAPTMAYRLVPAPEHDCARIVWEGVVDVAANDLTADREHGDRSVVAEAQEWLLGYLADNGGEAPRGDIIKAGRAAGFSKQSLDRAKAAGKIAHESGGFPRSTTWLHPDAASRLNASETTDLETTEITGMTSENTVNGGQSPQGLNPETTEEVSGTGTVVPLYPEHE